MIINLLYSDRKIKVNFILLYSVLNPETSSDSPSAKSKGARLTSIKHEILHKKNKGSINNKFAYILKKIVIVIIEKLLINSMILTRINAKQISYEIVWAIARSLPIKPYFEFDDHPEKINPYTLKLIIIRKNRRLYLKSINQ